MRQICTNVNKSDNIIHQIPLPGATMELRRCPACKNMVAAESISCPICGCEPGKRLLRRIVTGSALLIVAIWLLVHLLVTRAR